MAAINKYNVVQLLDDSQYWQKPDELVDFWELTGSYKTRCLKRNSLDDWIYFLNDKEISIDGRGAAHVFATFRQP